MQYISGRNPKRPQTFVSKMSVALSVMLWAITHVVRLPIHLHDKAGLMTVEIENVWRRRMLIAELEPAGTLPQSLP